MSKKVTVALTVYNEATTLNDRIVNILNQTFTDFQLLIADNCSQDGTVKIASSWCDLDPRVRLIMRRKNLGAHVNHYKTVFESEGDYFIWAAADDWWEEDFLRRLVEENENNSCPLSMTDLVKVNDQTGKEKCIELSRHGCFGELKMSILANSMFKMRRERVRGIQFFIYGLYDLKKLKALLIETGQLLSFGDTVLPCIFIARYGGCAIPVMGMRKIAHPGVEKVEQWGVGDPFLEKRSEDHFRFNPKKMSRLVVSVSRLPLRFKFCALLSLIIFRLSHKENSWSEKKDIRIKNQA